MTNQYLNCKIVIGRDGGKSTDRLAAIIEVWSERGTGFDNKTHGIFRLEDALLFSLH